LMMAEDDANNISYLCRSWTETIMEEIGITDQWSTIYITNIQMYL